MVNVILNVIVSAIVNVIISVIVNVTISNFFRGSLDYMGNV